MLRPWQVLLSASTV